jgi:hypothetical protein
MEKIDTFKCPIIEFRSSHSVMRSKKVTRAYLVNTEQVLRRSPSIDEPYNEAYNTLPIPIKQVKTNSKERYFYIQDGYLYLPDSEVVMIQVSLITLDLNDMEECSDCEWRV